MVLSVCGHRPNKLGGYRTPNFVYDAVVEGLDKKLIELKPDSVILGMALGVDQWTAELCLRNEIPFIAAVPCDGYESLWPQFSQVEYRRLLREASAIHTICPGGYRHGVLETRNQWMVDNSDSLLAVFNGTASGTGNCVRYARRGAKRVHFVCLSEEVWSEARRIEGRILEAREQRTVIGVVSIRQPAPEGVASPVVVKEKVLPQPEPPVEKQYRRLIDVGED